MIRRIFFLFAAALPLVAGGAVCGRNLPPAVGTVAAEECACGALCEGGAETAGPADEAAAGYARGGGKASGTDGPKRSGFADAPEGSASGPESGSETKEEVAVRDSLRRRLEARILAVAAEVRATVGVAVVFAPGDTLAVNGDRLFPLMSVCKFHQALALLDDLSRRGMPMTTRLPVRKSDLLPDTYSPLRDARPEGGYDLSVAELLRYSVGLSDNNVCDLLFRHLGGPAAVDRYVEGVGVGGTEIRADEETMHRSPAHQRLNRATPLSVVRLLELFRRGALLPEEWGDLLAKTMFATATGVNKLRAGLPASAALAHKTGSADRDADGVMIAENDAGFVRLADGREYSIVVFVADSYEDDDTNAAVIARISQEVFRYVAASR